MTPGQPFLSRVTKYRFQPNPGSAFGGPNKIQQSIGDILFTVREQVLPIQIPTAMRWADLAQTFGQSNQAAKAVTEPKSP